jgi:GcrA cell cycle regulator
MVWDEQTIHDLKDLWAQGHSTAEIGRRLGVSKNAIVGKAHRLELDARPSPIRRDVAKPPNDRTMPCPRAAGPTLPPLASADMAAFPGPGANAVPPLSQPHHPQALHHPQPAESDPVHRQPDQLESDPPPRSASRSIDATMPTSTPADLTPADLTPADLTGADAPPPGKPARPAPPATSFQARRSSPACCWPIGEPGTKTFQFCDDTSLPGKPYCGEHAKLAYVKIRDRREDAA